MSITEVGEAANLPSSALRYYEKTGLIKPAGRRGGRRVYEPSVLRRLAVIAMLQEVGFTIKEIGFLVLPQGKKRWHSLATTKLEEIDAHIERAQEARDLLVSALDCGCSTLDTCELVGARRGRHERAIKTLPIGFGPPDRETNAQG